MVRKTRFATETRRAQRRKKHEVKGVRTKKRTKRVALRGMKKVKE